MGTDLTNPEDQDYELLALFMRSYEEARDPTTVLQSWSEHYPHLATRFVSQARTHRLLEKARPDPEPAPPERLGDFRIDRRIASGGMGVIYEAVQEPFGRRVAVKTIRTGHFSEQARERFVREQEVLARLHQTHIVPIYAAGQAEHLHYFAMPYIQGASLRDLIQDLRRQGGIGPTRPLATLVRRLTAPPPPDPVTPTREGRKPVVYYRSVAEGLADAAEAVAYAHERGILHRDLKPGNLMVDEAGHVWVLDFGLAGHLRTDEPSGLLPAEASSSGDLTLPGGRIGTPDYMAPEQLEGKADVRSDVWGLGAVLYELLTLRRAFEPAAPGEDRALVGRQQELSRPLEWPTQIPADLKAITSHCLAPEPAARYPSAQALADDLRRYLRGEETTVRPHPPGERLRCWLHAHPAQGLVLILSALLLLLVMMVVGHCWELRADNEQYTRKLAGTVTKQVQLLQEAVLETAARPALQQGLAHGLDHPQELHQILEETNQDFRVRLRWFKRPGEAPPFINWYVMDREGNLLTDSDPAFVQGNFRDRDYANLLREPPTDRNAIAVSRVFKSTQDLKYKFAVATRVWDGDRLLGLVAATSGTDSKLVALDMQEERPGALVAGPMDWSRQPGTQLPPDQLPPFVIVLSRDYRTSGVEAKEVRVELRPTLQKFQNRPQLREEMVNDWSGGGFAHFARVGDSPFVVIVEQSYPWPMPLFWKHSLWFRFLPAAGLVLLVVFGGWSWKKRRGVVP